MTGNSGARSRALRLEEFDRVAGWILDEDLAAARSLDDLTTERSPLSSETLNGSVEIGNHDLEPIPPSGCGNATSFARATYARLVEKQSQVILRQTAESRGSKTETVPTKTKPPDRHARRREATRTKLIEAAKALIARQGVDNTRIREITDEADVGFGSLYNHFESKEAIIEAVLAHTVAAQGAEIVALTAALEDAAEIISAAHRSFVRRARSDPDWAWLLVRLDVSHNVLLAALGPTPAAICATA